MALPERLEYGSFRAGQFSGAGGSWLGVELGPSVFDRSDILIQSVATPS